MALTFTGTNERRLTKQKSFSFLLENCSVNNLTGTAEFGFKDSSNEFKFNLNQGNIFDPDDRNCFSYVKDEKFSISGDFSDTKYTYKINDVLVAQGKTKASFNVEKFFINTTSCTVSAENLKIYSDGITSTITCPENVEKTTSFDVSVSITSSDPNECLYIFGVSLATGSSTAFTINSFTNEITNSTSGTINITHTGTVSTTNTLKLDLDTNVGTIQKTFSINFHDAPTRQTANVLQLLETNNVTSESSTWKEYIYQFTSSVVETEYVNFTTTSVAQNCHVSLEYVSGNIGTFNKVTGVNITAGGSNYVDPVVEFGAATSPDVTATGTVTASGGVINSVNITNSGNYYAASPTVTFSERVTTTTTSSGTTTTSGPTGSGATGVPILSSSDKTYTNVFNLGTGFVRNSLITDFLARGLTEAQGDAAYNTTYGDGKYKTTSTISVTEDQVLYIKVIAVDHDDNHPISAKLKIEPTYPDSVSGNAEETATIDITS